MNIKSTKNFYFNLSKSSPWSHPLNPEILYPIKYFERLLLDLGWEDPSEWLNHWIYNTDNYISRDSWTKGTKSDWFWGLGLPLLTDIERHLSNERERSIIGISGLPGSGKTSLGRWIEAAANELGWPVSVISLDDFYLPANELDIAMSGNPWNVPRGIPGSHSIDLLIKTIDIWKKNGSLNAPIFEKFLRGGLGNRSGWKLTKPKLIIIEGWFLGCLTCNNLLLKKQIQENKFIELELNQEEVEYRKIIQDSLFKYQPIWKEINRVWHIKAINFNSTIDWKTEQEENLYKEKGASLKGKSLSSFIRMIQTAIPQEDLMKIPSDVVARINTRRELKWVGISKDEENSSDYK